MCEYFQRRKMTTKKKVNFMRDLRMRVIWRLTYLYLIFFYFTSFFFVYDGCGRQKIFFNFIYVTFQYCLHSSHLYISSETDQNCFLCSFVICALQHHHSIFLFIDCASHKIAKNKKFSWLPAICQIFLRQKKRKRNQIK